MKEKSLNERNARVLTIVAVVLLLIVVIGATYAYFQAQVGNGTSTSINATTGTTDILTFYNEDLDVAQLESDKVTDENTDEEIIINAKEENFGKVSKSLGDGVIAKAKLTANNANNIAKKQKYNVFIVIDTNEIKYTQGENRPELIMKVTAPDGTEVKEITGLKYHDAEANEPNDVSGFDITKRTGSYAIKKEQEIEVTGEQENHYTEQEWKIEIILVNLKEDQNENGGKSVNGRILITTEDKETYELAHINSIAKYEISDKSISGTLNFTKGTSDIKEYWYKIESLGINEPAAILLDDNGFTLNEEGATFEFTGLAENTKYKISSYVVDENGIKSEIYTTDVFRTESGEDEKIVTDKLPIIKKASVSEVKYNSFKVTIDEVEEGSNKIDHYSYHIEGGTKNETYDNKKENYFVFTDLSEGQQYSVEIEAIDTKGQASPVYDFNDTETTTDTLPKISKIEATTIAPTSLKFTITAQKGNVNISSYSCSLKQGETNEIGTKDGTITNSDTSVATCEFTGLKNNTDYTLTVVATDEHGNESIPTSGIGKTELPVIKFGSYSDYYKTSTYKDKIKNVYFVDYIANDTILNQVKSWDLSRKQDGSIKGWLVQETNDDVVPYNLYIGSNGEIKVESYENAFYQLSNVETIDLNIENVNTNSLTSTYSMFYDCNKLTTIKGIDKINTSNVTNMYYMFYRVNSLTELNLSTWDTSSVTNMAGMFRDYKGKEIKGIESLNTSNVTDISAIFYYANNLTKLDLSRWNTSNVKDMSYMFYHTDSLIELKLSSTWDTSSVTNMAGMFSGSGLTTLDLSTWDTSNVVKMYGMFRDYKGKEIKGIESLNTTKVDAMSYIFSGASSLQSLDISKWDTSNVTDMSYMFSGASNLANIDMRKATFSQVTKYNGMFSSTNKNLKVTITGEENKNWFNNNNVFPVKDTQQLIVLP